MAPIVIKYNFQNKRQYLPTSQYFNCYPMFSFFKFTSPFSESIEDIKGSTCRVTFIHIDIRIRLSLLITHCIQHIQLALLTPAGSQIIPCCLSHLVRKLDAIKPTDKLPTNVYSTVFLDLHRKVMLLFVAHFFQQNRSKTLKYEA